MKKTAFTDEEQERIDLDIQSAHRVLSDAWESLYDGDDTTLLCFMSDVVTRLSLCLSMIEAKLSKDESHETI